MCGIKGSRGKYNKTIKCVICGKEVVRNSKATGAKYCDGECQDIGAHIRRMKRLHDKDVPIDVARAYVRERKRLGMDHITQAKQLVSEKAIKKVCAVCGKEYMTNRAAKNRSKYCGQECYKSAHNKIKEDFGLNQYLNNHLNGHYFAKKNIQLEDPLNVQIEQLLIKEGIEVMVV